MQLFGKGPERMSGLAVGDFDDGGALDRRNILRLAAWPCRSEKYLCLFFLCFSFSLSFSEDHHVLYPYPSSRWWIDRNDRQQRFHSLFPDHYINLYHIRHVAREIKYSFEVNRHDAGQSFGTKQLEGNFCQTRVDKSLAMVCLGRKIIGTVEIENGCTNW